MSVALGVTVALAGGVGAWARFWLDRGVRRLVGAWGDPLASRLGIVAVNVGGCFLAGVVSRVLSGDCGLVVSAGLLGGFTTFSTAVVDAVTLWDGRWRCRALVLLLGTWAASWVGAVAGIVCAG